MPAMHLRISGHVQGVYFRDGALKEALKLGLTGWVCNTNDGAVEAHIEGSPEAINAMIAWCQTGPPAARVEGVDVRDASEEGHAIFEIR
jgi:acylphosphatase